MRRLAGTIVMLACLAILLHDAVSGRMSVFRKVYSVHDLNKALVRGPERKAAMLLRRGADPNAKNRSGRTPLHHTVLHFDVELVEFLIRNGAHVNATDVDGRTPLHWALSQEAFEVRPVPRANQIVRCLLANGADISARDSSDLTPLHEAACNCLRSTVEILLERGADVNARDNGGNTPLHCSGNGAIAVLLIASGADVNARNKAGQRPLHIAAKQWDEDMAELLILKGADVNATDHEGNTALDVTQSPEMEALLRKRGGKTGKELK